MEPVWRWGAGRAALTRDKKIKARERRPQTVVEQHGRERVKKRESVTARAAAPAPIHLPVCGDRAHPYPHTLHAGHRPAAPPPRQGGGGPRPPARLRARPARRDAPRLCLGPGAQAPADPAGRGWRGQDEKDHYPSGRVRRAMVWRRRREGRGVRRKKKQMGRADARGKKKKKKLTVLSFFKHTGPPSPPWSDA